MNKLFTLILGLVILTSCDKEEEGPSMSYPSKFVFKQLKNTTPIRMFTKNGEVMNPALIEKFALKWSDSYFVEDKVEERESTESLVFTSNSSAELRKRDNVENFEVKYSKSNFTLTSVKEYSGAYSKSDEHILNIIAAISKYKPLIYDKQAIPSNPGLSYIYKSRNQLFAKLKGDELHVDRMVFTLKSGDKNSYRVNSISFNNAFDVSGTSLLRETDTLVVQEFVVIAFKE